jgi:hypothetical protein
VAGQTIPSWLTLSSAGVLRADAIPQPANQTLFTFYAQTGMIVRGEMPAPVARNQAPALSFLQGDAMALPLSPFAYLPVLKPDPSWLPPTTWESVDRARSAMIAATTEDAEILARYRLGLHYLEMGLGKEARHYLSGISEAPGPIPQVDLSMAKAHAALACGDWDRAREAYREAALMGAPGPAVVEGLAVEGVLALLPLPHPALADRLGKPILQLRRPLLLPCPVWLHTTINSMGGPRQKRRTPHDHSHESITFHFRKIHGRIFRHLHHLPRPMHSHRRHCYYRHWLTCEPSAR